MFKVGDFVIGKPDNGYLKTNNKRICLVVNVYNDEMDVVIIGAISDGDLVYKSNGNAYGYSVWQNRFSLYDKEIPALIPELTLPKDNEVWNYEYISDSWVGSESYIDISMLVTMVRENETYISLKNTVDNILNNGETLEFSDKTCSEIFDMVEGTGHPTKHLDMNLDKAEKNKKSLYNFLRKHPNWDEERLAVVLKDCKFIKITESKEAKKFLSWLRDDMLVRYIKNHDVSIGGMKYGELKDIYRKYDRLHDVINSLKASNVSSLYINGVKKTLDEITEEYLKWRKILRNVGYDFYNPYDDYFVERDVNNIRGFVLSSLDDIISYNLESVTVIEKTASSINQCAQDLGIKMTVQEGQKLTKLVYKLAKMIEADKFVNIQDKVNPEDGKVKKVDMGWKKKWAEFGDAITPQEYTRTLCFSINPNDYYSMSNGTSWSSCHITDPAGNLFRTDSNSYHGQFMTGCLSYMVDGVTIVAYTVNEEKYSPVLSGYGSECLELYPKERRQMYCMSDDLVSGYMKSRLYPDGRDGGETSLDGQFNKYFLNVLKTIYKVDKLNYKEVSSSSSNNRRYIDASQYYGYDDWNNYSDPKHYILNKSKYHLTIGRDVYGLGDGEINHCKDNIDGDGDYEDDDEVTCCRCGCTIDRDDALCIEDEFFCDDECAREYGWFYICDEDDYVWEDDVIYCDDDGEYHRVDNTVTVNCPNGYTYTYHSDDAAIENGCEYIDSEGEWFAEGMWRYCEHCGTSVLIENWNEEQECCNDCATEIEEDAA